MQSNLQKISTYTSQNDHQQNVNKQSINQDGGVEGRALTPSCESTRITTGKDNHSHH